MAQFIDIQRLSAELAKALKAAKTPDEKLAAGLAELAYHLVAHSAENHAALEKKIQWQENLLSGHRGELRTIIELLAKDSDEGSEQ